MKLPRGMSSTGKRWAALLGVMGALALPKQVVCGYPGGECRRDAPFRQVCEAYELEPIAFYFIELLAHRDVGFAYKTGDKCR